MESNLDASSLELFNFNFLIKSINYIQQFADIPAKLI